MAFKHSLVQPYCRCGVCAFTSYFFLVHLPRKSIFFYFWRVLFTNLTHPQANRLELVWNWTSSLRLFTETLRSGFSFFPEYSTLWTSFNLSLQQEKPEGNRCVVNMGVNLDLPPPKRTQDTCHFEPSHRFTRRQRHINTDDISFSCDYNVLKVPSCGDGTEMNVSSQNISVKTIQKVILTGATAFQGP